MDIKTVLWACQRWHQGDQYRFSDNDSEREAWQAQADLIAEAIRLMEAGNAD